MDKFVVSARKYRPVTFNEVVGQGSITNTLKNSIKNNHIAQAFLFTGPRGVGKTTCARIFAKTINCQNPTDDMEPCNECESCKSFNSSSSFNVHELDAASNNSVDDIRRLVEQVRIPPQVGNYKVYIIDEVHMLSQAAFNAFLKTLEEPPDYAKFILATTEKHKIIPTILSRCQIYDFNRITVRDITEHLEYVAKTEGINAEEEALHIVAKKADGALRDALSIFDQLVSFCGRNISYEATLENLNVLNVEYYFRLVDYFLQKNITESLLLYDAVISKGFEGHHFINGLADHFRNLLVVKDTATVKLLEVADATKKHLIEQSSFCSLKFIIKALDICTQVDINYKTVQDKRLYVELNLLKLCELNGAISDSPVASMPSKPKVAEPVKATASGLPSKPKQQSEKPKQQTKIKPPPTIKEEVKPKKTTIPDSHTKDKVGTNESKSKAIKAHNPVKKPKSFGFSIKEDMEASGIIEDKKTDASAELKANYEKAEKIVDTDSLKESIIEYSKLIKKDQMAFSVALSPEKITIEDNNTVKLVFSNKSMDDIDLKYGLLKFLKQKFNNNQIQLKTEVIEEDIVIKDEPMEKYLKMKKENPVVEKIRTQLNLDF